ncbi:hypothetical protein SLNSH_23945 [Alsobacter soli]|uniref:Uncharacterized protein n=1 Tax=Alsobacter soli TaxID=2109933 RepID=A0A2T1HLC6_9HYPH|nr:hypothetical protein SLNSH_23945 [Alsobacter soli]
MSAPAPDRTVSAPSPASRDAPGGLAHRTIIFSFVLGLVNEASLSVFTNRTPTSWVAVASAVSPDPLRI